MLSSVKPPALPDIGESPDFMMAVTTSSFDVGHLEFR
jgi:hypothetical protein